MSAVADVIVPIITALCGGGAMKALEWWGKQRDAARAAALAITTQRVAADQSAAERRAAADQSATDKLLAAYEAQATQAEKRAADAAEGRLRVAEGLTSAGAAMRDLAAGVDRAAQYAGERVVFGKPLAVNQAVQWPLAELQTEAQMVRLLVYYAAWHLDRDHHMEVSDKVSMANYRANRLVCEAADRAMQIHGGIGYSRHEPFEHIYRHHRRYRITEGAEEIQIRRVAQRMLKFGRK